MPQLTPLPEPYDAQIEAQRVAEANDPGLLIVQIRERCQNARQSVFLLKLDGPFHGNRPVTVLREFVSEKAPLLSAFGPPPPLELDRAPQTVAEARRLIDAIERWANHFAATSLREATFDAETVRDYCRDQYDDEHRLDRLRSEFGLPGANLADLAAAIRCHQVLPDARQRHGNVIIPAGEIELIPPAQPTDVDGGDAPPASGETTIPVGPLSATDLATLVREDPKAVDTFLRRLAKSDPDCRIETGTDRRSEPKWMYRLPIVWAKLTEWAEARRRERNC
jgi:hypothetical protein